MGTDGCNGRVHLSDRVLPKKAWPERAQPQKAKAQKAKPQKAKPQKAKMSERQPGTFFEIGQVIALDPEI